MKNLEENQKELELKFICKLKSGTNLTSEQIESSGSYPVYGGNGVRGYYENYNLDGKNILVGRQGALCGNVHITNDKLWATEHAWAVKLQDNLRTDLEYLYYLLIGLNLNQYASDSAAQPGLSANVIHNLHVPLISYDEQVDIAQYLKCMDRKIDNAIKRHITSIDNIKEYIHSLISDAILKGLREDKKKETDSMWFPNIPTGWKIEKIKYIFSINKRIAGKEGHTVLSITQRGIIPKDLSKNEGQIAQSYANYQIVHEGDFAMNHMDLLTGWVDISQYEGVTSPDYRVFTLNDTKNNNPKYFLYIMQMCYFNRIFYNMGAGVSELGRWRLQATPFREFKVPVPPIDEQNEIVKFLDEKCAKADEAIKRQEMAIEKLEEYRKSIIYHAVTGKIDCRKEKGNE